jgi:Tol biopolymer transport system component
VGTDLDTGEPIRVDLPSGNARTLVRKRRPDEGALHPVLSPDSRTVAYAWFDGLRYDLRVVSSAVGSAATPPRLLLPGRGLLSILVFDWSPDGKEVLVALLDSSGTRTRIAGVSAKDGSVRELLTTGSTEVRGARYSPDGQWIVYSTVGGGSRLYLLPANGTGSAVALDSTSAASAPCWTPDGRHVVFTRRLAGQVGLWSIPVREGKRTGEPAYLRELTGASFLGILSDGRIASARNSGMPMEVFTAALGPASAGIPARSVAVGSRFSGMNLLPTWSPDGSRLAYQSRRSDERGVIVIRDLADGSEREVRTGLDLEYQISTTMAWHPDGNGLLVQAKGAGGARRHYRIDANSGAATLVFEYPPSGGPSEFSPDGRRLYYLQHEEATGAHKESDVVIARDLATGESQAVWRVPYPASVTSFMPSPDGRLLAAIVYHRQLDGRPSELAVLSLASRQVRRLFSAPWSDETKFGGIGWTPDSRHLLYVRLTPDFRDAELWRIGAAGGTPERTGVRMKIIRMPRVHPDGARVVFGGARSRPVVTLWAESIDVERR